MMFTFLPRSKQHMCCGHGCDIMALPISLFCFRLPDEDVITESTFDETKLRLGQAKYPITHNYADFENFYSKNETQTNDTKLLIDT